ncbi:L,D-transpeptidase family protein [Catalinimonas sp. 4WD22]|uniref:L,D-transpeptidase family protein n=1 Tax=Catalinimonas locisalis TaxID=3133978 RepID=UPI0031018D5E
MDSRLVTVVRVLAVFSSIFLAVFAYALLPTRRLAQKVLAERLVVYKSKRQLQLWSNGKLIKTYKIALGRQPVGAKRREGDMRTPEGTYYIYDKNPQSVFYLNLGISYPNAEDQTFAVAGGFAHGSAIKIHGLRNGNGWRGRFHRHRDWTAGCIAVTNAEMDELYRTVPLNTSIEIYP